MKSYPWNLTCVFTIPVKFGSVFSGSHKKLIYFHLLHCTRSKVQGLCYAPHAKKLISCSEDGVVRIWDMNVKRQEVCLNNLHGGMACSFFTERAGNCRVLFIIVVSRKLKINRLLSDTCSVREIPWKDKIKDKGKVSLISFFFFVSVLDTRMVAKWCLWEM